MNDLFSFDPLKIADNAIEGNAKREEAYATLYVLHKRTETALALLRENGALDAVAEYGKEGYIIGDLCFRRQEGGRIYEYDHIPAIQKKIAQLNALKAIAKTAADALEKGRGGTFDKKGVVDVPAIIKRKVDSIVATTVKHPKSIEPCGT